LQCDRFADLLDDTSDWLTARCDPARPCFVVGHSMGGLVAVSLAAAGRLDVAGLVTLGAALRITPATILEQATAQAALDPDVVVVPMSRSGFEASTRDPAMAAEVHVDPIHGDVAGVPAGLLATTGAHAARLLPHLEQVEVPLLAMHGTADLMADPAATVDLVERAASSDKQLQLVEGGYHALLRDLDREHTIATIIDWIEQRR
jgi:lysophospholipase